MIFEGRGGEDVSQHPCISTIFRHDHKRFSFFPVLAAVLVGVLILSSCSSGPKAEGEDFITSSSSYKSKGKARGSAFVSPKASQKIYLKVAVMPFRAPLELAGASVADMFSTELLKTYKYSLVERSQMEQVLNEQALGLKGVTESALAMRVGRMLNVQGVIVGTVPEYGMRAVGSDELPAVGINVRMIDVETGSIVWSVSDSAIAGKPISISAFSRHLVESMIYRLVQEWKRAGDTYSVNLPTPQVVAWKGGLRKVELTIMGDPAQRFEGYRILRSQTLQGPFVRIGSLRSSKNEIVFEDEKLIDAETYYYKVDGVSRLGLTGPPAGPFQVTTVGPPSPVSQLRAESNVARKVPITWTPVNEPEVEGYAIFRADSASGPFKEIKYIRGKDKDSYLDKGKGGGFFSSGGGLKDYTEYFYKIQVVNVVDVRSPFSPVISAVTKPVPVRVAGITANQGEVKKATLRWEPNPEPDIKEYEIFRGDSPDDMRRIDDVSGAQTQYVDDRLKDGRKYYYKVRAVDEDKLEGEFSDIVYSDTKPVPVRPTGLTARLNGGRVDIEWLDNPERDIAKYLVYMKGFLWKMLGETSRPSFSYTGELKEGKTLTFRVIAVDATELESEPSAEVSVTVPQ